MIKKHFSKILCCLLTTTLTFGSDLTVFASDILPAPAKYTTISTLQRSVNSNITDAEIADASANGLKILEKITDPIVIQQMVDNGTTETDDAGSLPSSITLYFALDETAETPTLDTQNSLLRASDIIVTKTNYYDGRYFDDYDRYQINGPCQFETTYSKKGTANWNTSMTSEVSVGGTAYGIAEVKASVSSSVNYAFGVETTKTQKYTCNIPNGKYWKIKVWVSYLVYKYTAKVGTTTLATGYTWKPNGLVIEKTEYNN